MDNLQSADRMKWTVGIISTSRKDGAYYLDRTLVSLKNAGWDLSQVVIYAEPGAYAPPDFPGYVVNRRKQYGDWTNWACGLYELLLTEPNTDYFFMIEDDVIVCKGSKDYLEKHIRSLEPFGTVSLYCGQNYYMPDFVGFHNECRDWRTWPAQTMVFTRKGVISFYSDERVQRHRFEHTIPIPFEEVPWGVDVDPLNSVKDAVMGMWAAKNKLPMYYHSPSLAQHIGIQSSLTPEKEVHIAPDFVGEDFIPDFVPKIKRHVETQIF
jgi:hypothetical protein